MSRITKIHFTLQRSTLLLKSKVPWSCRARVNAYSRAGLQVCLTRTSFLGKTPNVCDHVRYLVGRNALHRLHLSFAFSDDLPQLRVAFALHIGRAQIVYRDVHGFRDSRVSLALVAVASLAALVIDGMTGTDIPCGR